MELSPRTERRSGYRLPFVSSFLCQPVDGSAASSGELRDVSITGCYGILTNPPPVGTVCTLSIVFQGDHSRLSVEEVRGTIVRTSAQGIAVHFEQRLEWFVLIPLFYKKICGTAPFSVPVQLDGR